MRQRACLAQGRAQVPAVLPLAQSGVPPDQPRVPASNPDGGRRVEVGSAARMRLAETSARLLSGAIMPAMHSQPDRAVRAATLRHSWIGLIQCRKNFHRGSTHGRRTVHCRRNDGSAGGPFMSSNSGIFEFYDANLRETRGCGIFSRTRYPDLMPTLKTSISELQADAAGFHAEATCYCERCTGTDSAGTLATGIEQSRES